MASHSDNWKWLVRATVKREQLRSSDQGDVPTSLLTALMASVYDIWERLVPATMERKQLRSSSQGAIPPSLGKTTTSVDAISQDAGAIQAEDPNVSRTFKYFPSSFWKWLVRAKENREAMAAEDGEGDRRRMQEIARVISQVETVTRWRKPAFGRLKLNCGAAWRKDTRVGGVGWVLRDFAGIPKLAGREGGAIFLSPIMAEAAAIRLALKMCVLRDIPKLGKVLEVETDSKELVQMLYKEIQAHGYMEVFLVDIWNMTRSFQSVKFIFTDRQCNRAAHTVAAYVLKHEGSFSWDELGPEFLFNILSEDANVSIRI